MRPLFAFEPWSPGGSAPSPSPSLRSALARGKGPILTRYVRTSWRGGLVVEARADALDMLQRVVTEHLDRIDCMLELLTPPGTPFVLVQSVAVLADGMVGELTPGEVAERLAWLRDSLVGDLAAAPDASDFDRLCTRVVVNALDPCPWVAAREAMAGSLELADALGVGPRTEIVAWQEEKLAEITPWSPPTPIDHLLRVPPELEAKMRDLELRYGAWALGQEG
ncbi:MAG: hypothetical protein ACYDEA_01870 [Candidatus Dormibacteria bacterium]